jgi:hypothetical protein
MLMKIPAIIALFAVMCFLLFIGGCTESESETDGPATSLAGYQTGDIIAKDFGSTRAVAVQSYDPTTDSYEIYDVTKTSSGRWIKKENAEIRSLARTATEDLYSERVGTTGSSQSVTTRPITVTTTANIENQDYTFIQTITYTTDSGKTVVTKNKLLKTASFEITSKIEKSENSRLNEFSTRLACGIIRLAFFNETAREEFQEQVRQWNIQHYTVTDDSPEEQQQSEPGENPLDGYEVTSARVRYYDEVTNAKISECTITGPDVDDVAVTMY